MRVTVQHSGAEIPTCEDNKFAHLFTTPSSSPSSSRLMNPLQSLHSANLTVVAVYSTRKSAR
jgi:hypothetical protein